MSPLCAMGHDGDTLLAFNCCTASHWVMYHPERVPPAGPSSVRWYVTGDRYNPASLGPPASRNNDTVAAVTAYTKCIVSAARVNGDGAMVCTKSSVNGRHNALEASNKEPTGGSVMLLEGQTRHRNNHQYWKRRRTRAKER